MSTPDLDLPPEAWDALLRALDPDEGPRSPQAGQRYLRLQERLTRFFEWRGVDSGDELAFETLRRVAIKLGRGVTPTVELGTYAMGFARNVLREHWRVAQGQSLPAIDPAADVESPEDKEDREILERCLERSAKLLGEADYAALLRFHAYDGRQRIEERKALAAELDKTVNALRIQAYRHRKELLAYLEGCLDGAQRPPQRPVDGRSTK
ncbi:MAG: hypothetical protein AAGE94_12585 [Acidobacteriota bacterium]